MEKFLRIAVKYIDTKYMKGDLTEGLSNHWLPLGPYKMSDDEPHEYSRMSLGAFQNIVHQHKPSIVFIEMDESSLIVRLIAEYCKNNNITIVKEVEVSENSFYYEELILNAA